MTYDLFEWGVNIVAKNAVLTENNNRLNAEVERLRERNVVLSQELAVAKAMLELKNKKAELTY